jgi:short-subunit dehydrogenase
MKRILILGASSQIGMALANEFALGNNLLLVGRDVSRLQIVRRICETSGASSVRLLKLDLSQGVEPLLQAFQGTSLDLLIDVASASSSKRDAEIDPTEINELLASDIISRTELLGQILSSQEKPPAVIYISTILTFVTSPGRVVYTSLKSLYEAYLQMLKVKHPDFQLLVVNVGTLVDTKEASTKARKLAAAVATAYYSKKEAMLYGMSGRMFVWLFYLQPLVFLFVLNIQRKVRNLLRSH